MPVLLWWTLWAFILSLFLFSSATTASEVEDDLLVQQARAGDLDAFNRLVGRHQRLMYNIAFRVMGDADRAADATQDAFLSAYRKLDQYHGGNFQAWMSRIVKNQCYDLLRYEKRRPAASLEALLVTTGDPSPEIERQRAPRPDESLMQDEMAAWLQAVIQRLPIEQRMTLVMADVHGYSYAEIADATEVELGTVKSRLFRARRALREELQGYQELLPHKYRFKERR